MSELAIGKVIRMPCMRRGLVKYPEETILVPQGALESMAQTARGIPVTIEHPGVAIDENNIGDVGVVGRVAKLDYDASQDLWMAEFVVDTEEGVKLLEGGYGVSTAWYGQAYTNGGTYNNVPYDRELVSARYEHLAIVQNPRYEMAIEPIFLNQRETVACENKDNKDNIVVNSNSNSFGGIKMFAKIWRTKKEEVKANENEELVLELEHGQVPLSKVVEELKAYQSSKQEEKKEAAKEEEPAQRKLQADDEVEVDGKKMKVSELVEKYNAMKADVDKSEEKKEAGADEEEEKPEAENADKGEEEEKKEQGEDEEAEDKKPEVKPNSKRRAERVRFNSLKEAYENGNNIEVESNFVSLRERVDMGRSRYGTKK